MTLEFPIVSAYLYFSIALKEASAKLIMNTPSSDEPLGSPQGGPSTIEQSAAQDRVIRSPPGPLGQKGKREESEDKEDSDSDDDHPATKRRRRLGTHCRLDSSRPYVECPDDANCTQEATQPTEPIVSPLIRMAKTAPELVGEIASYLPRTTLVQMTKVAHLHTEARRHLYRHFHIRSGLSFENAINTLVKMPKLYSYIRCYKISNISTIQWWTTNSSQLPAVLAKDHNDADILTRGTYNIMASIPLVKMTNLRVLHLCSSDKKKVRLVSQDLYFWRVLDCSNPNEWVWEAAFTKNIHTITIKRIDFSTRHVLGLMALSNLRRLEVNTIFDPDEDEDEGEDVIHEGVPDGSSGVTELIFTIDQVKFHRLRYCICAPKTLKKLALVVNRNLHWHDKKSVLELLVDRHVESLEVLILPLQYPEGILCERLSMFTQLRMLRIPGWSIYDVGGTEPQIDRLPSSLETLELFQTWCYSVEDKMTHLMDVIFREKIRRMVNLKLVIIGACSTFRGDPDKIVEGSIMNGGVYERTMLDLVVRIMNHTLDKGHVDDVYPHFGEWTSCEEV
ncbi:unnamed protein product [Periconia digitata]|uniref:Uncharacterized protein n=1 Tax=Periconia digitata TaxID=1303443 RepID=A0A9W4U4T8_9PLEO|nr:unnamed protein product [Periconia digitata]